MIFQNKKTVFLAIKRGSSKRRKIDIFPRGLTLGFGPKMAIFPTFFLGNIGQEYVFYDIVVRKNAFLWYKNNKFKNLKNLHCCKGVNACFSSKNGHSLNFFFQPIQARKMSCMIFQNEKTPFWAIKRRSSISRKIDIFPKGLTHGFGPKMSIFPTFFWCNIGLENVFYDILEKKNAFLEYKKKKFKKSKY